MLRIFYRVLAVSVMLSFSMNAFAQESAVSLAKRLQDKLLSSSGISMGFTLANEGHIAITVDLKDKKIRLESLSTLIISDGATIWNYQKQPDRVTIDNVAGTHSPFHDPQSIFKFSENYTSTIVSQRGSTYKLEFIPNVNLKSFTQSAGEMQKLLLEVSVHGKDIRIVKATASSTRGTSQANALTIKPLKNISAHDFIFTRKSTTKVLDLRE